MRTYRFDFCTKDQVVSSAERELPDDLDAIDAAEKLSKDFDVRIWRGTTLVASVNAGNRPSTPNDSRPG
jgi:hypothetical protein